MFWKICYLCKIKYGTIYLTFINNTLKINNKMKKLFIAFAALFTMGAVANAQDAFEMNVEGNAITITKTDFSNVSKADFQATETIADFDLSDLKVVSLPTEGGAISTVALKDAKGGNRVAGALLAIFLGDFGIHHFYTGDTRDGILHLVFFWTGIPALIGFIEGIMWLVDEGSFPSPLFKI